MNRFLEAALNIGTFGYYSHAKLRDYEKSIRDGSLAGTNFNSGAGGFVRVVPMGGDSTSRLFQKQNVRMLRNYAEFSTWVRAGLDIYRSFISQAQRQVEPYDPSKPMDEGVKRAIEELLAHPNAYGDSYAELIEQFVEDYKVLGHGVLEKRNRLNGTPGELYVLDAGLFGFVPDWSGDPKQPRYGYVQGYDNLERVSNVSKVEGTTAWLYDKDCMVLINRRRSYDLLGLSDLEVLDQKIRALLEGDDYLFNQVLQAAPNGALSLGRGTTRQQVEDLRQQIQAVKRAFVIIGGVDNDKTTYIPFNATARELQILDTQEWFVRQVAAVFQIPTSMLALAVDTSRANTEAMLDNAMEGLMVALEKVLQVENSQIVQTFGPHSAHNCKLTCPILSQKDEQRQASISQILVANQPISSINEQRAANGLEQLELDIANEILLQGPNGLTPLSELAKQFGSNFDNDINTQVGNFLDNNASKATKRYSKR